MFVSHFIVALSYATFEFHISTCEFSILHSSFTILHSSFALGHYSPRKCCCSFIIQHVLPQSSQVLKFPKREILAGDCAKCPVFLVSEAPNNSREVWGHAPPDIFEICTFQIAGNAPSSPPFCFFHAAF